MDKFENLKMMSELLGWLVNMKMMDDYEDDRWIMRMINELWRWWLNIKDDGLIWGWWVSYENDD
jgi:hypothetical protein